MFLLGGYGYRTKKHVAYSGVLLVYFSLKIAFATVGHYSQSGYRTYDPVLNRARREQKKKNDYNSYGLHLRIWIIFFFLLPEKYFYLPIIIQTDKTALLLTSSREVGRSKSRILSRESRDITDIAPRNLITFQLKPRGTT